MFCLRLLEGQISTSPASDKCPSCPSGTYSSSPASTSCNYCLAGQFAKSGDTQCSTCNAGTYSVISGNHRNFFTCIYILFTQYHIDITKTSNSIC